MNQQTSTSNSTQFEQNVLEGLRAIYKRIAIASEQTAAAVNQMACEGAEAPNYQPSLETFSSFDWSSIGATVERSDAHGVAIVNWRGLQFVRRAPSNKFGEAIWFSRCTGKNEKGENCYERLITFKAVSRVVVEPLPEKGARA